MKRFLPTPSKLIDLLQNFVATKSPLRTSSHPFINRHKLLRSNFLVTVSAAMALCSCHKSLDQQLHMANHYPEMINIDSPKSLENDTSVQMRAQEAFIEHYDNFSLGTIEFDDEGLYFSDKQRLAVNQMIQKESDESTEGVILVVFIHGWKHNATVCDSNVACFRSVLQFLGQREAAAKTPRRVIGIYLGWRGLTYCNQVSEQFTILNRKLAGENLGANQARRIINDLLTLYNNRIKPGHAHSRFVAVGHSLGGGVLFSAVGPMYRQALKDAMDENPDDKKLKPIRGFKDTNNNLVEFPDLVVLANPAFEAELYRRTPEDLGRLRKDGRSFSEDQLPLMLSISSTGDTGTRIFFPIGQTIKAIFSPSAWIHGPSYLLRNIITAANYGPYVTDTAYRPRKNSGQEASQKQTNRPENCFTGDFAKVVGLNCGCDEVSPQKIEELVPRSRERTRETAENNKREYGEKSREYGIVKLTRADGVDRYNPFLVVKADTTVIKDHDDIFNPNFISLLMDLIIKVDESKYASESP